MVETGSVKEWFEKGLALLEANKFDEALKAYEELISHLDVPYLKFQCGNCGFRPSELQWQCPQCRQWDTIDFVEARPADTALFEESKEPLPVSSTNRVEGEE